MNLYGAMSGNPMSYVDPTGLEPLKNQVGTAASFKTQFDTVRVVEGVPFNRGGTTAQESASQMLSRYGATTGIIPKPAGMTKWINESSSRYVYTSKGGWIDMSHFMFYAGQAYAAKQEIQQEIKAGAPQWSAGVQMCPNVDVAGEAKQRAIRMGYLQEFKDGFDDSASQYSYEDLPSDAAGADFGARAFNPNSKKTLGEQVNDYLNSLGATDPSKAPNWKDVPRDDNYARPTGPEERNETTTPMFTSQ